MKTAEVDARIQALEEALKVEMELLPKHLRLEKEAEKLFCSFDSFDATLLKMERRARDSISEAFRANSSVFPRELVHFWPSPSLYVEAELLKELAIATRKARDEAFSLASAAIRATIDASRALDDLLLQAVLEGDLLLANYIVRQKEATWRTLP